MLLKNLREEIDATLARDPAARSRLEVVLCYPGFQALLYHRLAHWLWQRGWLLAGRFVSHVGRVMTGIEIHPGARIGRRVFIDHGMGVVIGETAEVGDDCTLYQGVTLGGTSLTRGAKRHPTIGNGVIVSSHAQILGPFRVGDGARIGAQAVVLNEVPEGATMVGIPARPVARSSLNQRFSPMPSAATFPIRLPARSAGWLTRLQCSEHGWRSSRTSGLPREPLARPARASRQPCGSSLAPAATALTTI